MPDLGRILIADDDETFVNATADLLRGKGYMCDAVNDADGVLEQLSHDEYDVLISDIRMPGNTDLDLIKTVAKKNRHLPVILITGYPSVQSAIDSLNLPVLTYMVKPMDFDELLNWVSKGVQRNRSFHDFDHVRERLAKWSADLDQMEHLIDDDPKKGMQSVWTTFLGLSAQNVLGSVVDLYHVIERTHGSGERQTPCHLLGCSKPARLTAGIQEAVTVLERTKSSFKSKELAKLRVTLEKLLVPDPGAGQKS